MVGILAGTVEDAMIVLVILSVIILFSCNSEIGFKDSCVPLFVVMQLSVVKFHPISPLVHR